MNNIGSIQCLRTFFYIFIQSKLGIASVMRRDQPTKNINLIEKCIVYCIH